MISTWIRFNNPISFRYSSVYASWGILCFRYSKPSTPNQCHITKTNQGTQGVGVGFRGQGNDFTPFCLASSVCIQNTKEKNEERNGSNIDLCASCQNKWVLHVATKRSSLLETSFRSQLPVRISHPIPCAFPASPSPCTSSSSMAPTMATKQQQ